MFNVILFRMTLTTNILNLLSHYKQNPKVGKASPLILETFIQFHRRWYIFEQTSALTGIPVDLEIMNTLYAFSQEADISAGNLESEVSPWNS